MRQILKVGDTYQGEVITSITLHYTSIDAEQQYDGSWVDCGSYFQTSYPKAINLSYFLEDSDWSVVVTTKAKSYYLNTEKSTLTTNY